MEPLRPEDFIVYQHQETFKDRVRTELRQIKTKRNIMQGLVNFSVKTVIERRKEEIEVLRKIGTLDQYLHWKDKAEPVKKKRKEQIHLEKEASTEARPSSVAEPSTGRLSTPGTQSKTTSCYT